MPKREPSAITR